MVSADPGSESWREVFPVLKDCVYFNSNSHGAFPIGIRGILDRYWETLAHWRDDTWERWWQDILDYREAVARFLGGAAGTVIQDGNVSTLLGRLGTALDFRAPRNRIVTTDLEFPTTIFLWRSFAKYGAELLVVPSGNGSDFDEEALCAAIDERTALVCVSHAAYITGALLDVSRIARHAHAQGALVAIDAYQTAGIVPIDVQALDVDFLLSGVHKWLCGSTECAFMYIRPSLLACLEPAATGWIASDNPLAFEPAIDYLNSVRFAADARRFASGTPAILPVWISQLGLDIVSKVGMLGIRELSLRYADEIIARADEAGLPVLTPRQRSRRAGVVALQFPGQQQVAEQLQREGYICSCRGALRIAPHFYNTPEEVGRFMDALIRLTQPLLRK